LAAIAVLHFCANPLNNASNAQMTIGELCRAWLPLQNNFHFKKGVVMVLQINRAEGNLPKWAAMALLVLLMSVVVLPRQALAVPAFARQTGQNCVACHAGGQFPELTPYGRMFKMTGYTIGQRTMPFSVMGLASISSVANPEALVPGAAPTKNSTPIFATGSLFLAGKVTDNIGGFVQVTYDPYVDNGDGTYSGHSSADNIDIRYANRIVDAKQDWVYGVSLNNHPSVSDPWNTVDAWMQYVPVPSPASSNFIDGHTPYPGLGSGGNVAGLSAYTFWNQTVYAELGTYRTASQALSFLSAGVGDGKTKLSGNNNPYWRLALSHEWGPHNIMVGATGMTAHIFDAAIDTGIAADIGTFHDTGLDMQYQYLLDPHAVTVQLAHMRNQTDPSPASIQAAIDAADPTVAIPANGTITTNRAKVSYVYKATYGGSLAAFSSSGTNTDGTDPATTGMTYEAFYIPMQNVRLGLQYTSYGKFNGLTDNYDGAGRNASDNNSLFLYAWFAF
jgi:hypothetical protein